MYKLTDLVMPEGKKDANDKRHLLLRTARAVVSLNRYILYPFCSTHRGYMSSWDVIMGYMTRKQDCRLKYSIK
jgi:hypothetical protein